MTFGISFAEVAKKIITPVIVVVWKIVFFAHQKGQKVKSSIITSTNFRSHGRRP